MECVVAVATSVLLQLSFEGKKTSTSSLFPRQPNNYNLNLCACAVEPPTCICTMSRHDMEGVVKDVAVPTSVKTTTSPTSSATVSGPSKPKAKSQGAQKPYQTHSRKKRPPKRLTSARRVNDIYVNRHSDFASQLARCRKLLDQGVNVLYIHGLGAAINRSINLALQLKETHDEKLELKVTTATVEVTDDMEPLTETCSHYTHTRNVSALNITLYKPSDSTTAPPH